MINEKAIDPDAKHWMNNIYIWVLLSNADMFIKNKANTNMLDDKNIGNIFCKLKSLNISLRPFDKYMDRR